MRSRHIQSEILLCLSDYKRHTYREIAEKIEINEKTVARHVQDLSCCYRITTYTGRYNGGVQLINEDGVKKSENMLSEEKIVFNVILYYNEIKFLIDLINLHEDFKTKPLLHRLQNLINK